MEIPQKIVDQLETIITDLEDLNKHTHSFLETVLGENEITIRGNSAGLLNLAAICVKLAQKTTIGSHYHFDQFSNLDECDIDFVIAYTATGHKQIS